MSSKSKAKPKATPATSPELPDIGTAQLEFTRRQTRLWVSLLIRVICLGILAAILTAQVPFLAQNRAIVDAISGILALFPFFTGFGRLHAWRIALGRRYNDAQRWSDTVTILRPLQGVQGRFFDATGEGRALLEQAEKEVGGSRE